MLIHTFIPIIATYYRGIKSKGINISAQFDVGQQCDTVHYAGRIHFFDHLDIDYSYPFRQHDARGRFVPITNLDNGLTSMPSDFTNTLSEKLELNEDVKDSVLFSMNEIVCNITSIQKQIAEGVFMDSIFLQNTK
jgi:hypothetical protein